MTNNSEATKKDVIIVGAGPGGMTAALYASRANLETLVIEQGAPGGELLNTSEVENYPGFSAISGTELAMKMYDSSTAFGAEHTYGKVDRIEVDGSTKYVYSGDQVYTAPVVIIATGSYNRELNVPGEKELAGRGVSYCAVCDGFFFKDKHLVVVGGGDSAVEEGHYLTQFASRVTIIHRRDQLRAQKILQDRAFSNDKIDFVWDSVVEEIMGNDQVEAVSIRNVKTGQESLLKTDGVFVYVGVIPNSQLVQGLEITDPEGWIITNEQMETSIPGLYAIGDVRQKYLRQVATAVGDGSIAGQKAYEYIESLKD
ncbi:thioredoxin-disulfide reductase [Hutsoniella sourekii]